MKRFWLREEIPIADELESLIPALREEFIKAHPEILENKIYAPPITDISKHGINHIDDDIIQNKKELPWKSDFLKYVDKKINHYNILYEDSEVKARYPTATALTKKYGNDCYSSGYSILDLKSQIHRHTDIENRDNKFIKIHIPIIIPKGDVFFECEGFEIDWSCLWAFDSQLVHSAYNNTDEVRVVYLFDIKRSALGLPIGEPYDSEREKSIPPFIRGALPKVYHSCQLLDNIDLV
jgi:hypothetical protein